MSLRRNRRAKIVATLGPASSDRDTLRSLFHAGVDVFRLNFSHGSAEDHAVRMAILREIEAETGRPIGVMADLQGPKLRVGAFAQGPVQLQPGQRFRLDLDPRPGNAERVCLPHPEIFAALAPGAELLLDDGRLRLRVDACDATSADTRVLVGGRLSERKGVNVPGVVLPISALTPATCATWTRRWRWAPTGSRCPSCSGPRTSSRPANGSATAPASSPSWRSPRRSSGWTRSSPRPTR